MTSSVFRLIGELKEASLSNREAGLICNFSRGEAYWTWVLAEKGCLQIPIEPEQNIAASMAVTDGGTDALDAG